MSLPSLLGAAGGLAFVLLLVLLFAVLARRLRPGGGAGEGPGRIRLLSRVALAPRQGVATLRVGERMLVVSYGEGGVRHLLDVDAGEAGDEVEAPGAGRGEGASFRAALGDAARKVPALRALALGLALAWALPATVAAEPAPATAGAEQSVVASPGASAAQATGRSPGAQAGPGAPGGLPDVRVSVGAGEDGALELSGPVGTVLFIGFLTLLPTLLLLMSSFTRILVVLHLLKQALGTQTAPPAHLLTAMALILTGFVMTPTLEAANERAIAPWMAGEMDSRTMLREASAPFRAFMLESTREQDLAQFVEMSPGPRPAAVDEIPLMTLTAAFVTSELTSAFQMGFALFLPFLVIDVVVASVLMSMGMFMLPPVMVSLPFKLLLFVLVDGWSLVLGSLVRSFA